MHDFRRIQRVYYSTKYTADENEYLTGCRIGVLKASHETKWSPSSDLELTHRQTVKVEKTVYEVKLGTHCHN